MINNKIKPANQGIVSLYYFIGDAIFMIQDLEGALGTSITLKLDVKYPGRISKQEADDFKKKNYGLTFGDAIEKAKKNSLYSDALYNDLKALKGERNWLIHKLLHDNLDDLNEASTRERLFNRIRAISNKAKILTRIVVEDSIEFSESKGVDVSHSRAYMKQYSHEV